ncbi:hypothetical protein [Imhoffiella purpurea]|uniref:hypothetical protein n=1 Tax=Imhoffiella purpurea TaxID=1249627 RepID=UPI0012FE342E|nr:hypothetical protein [Imhoffiella purpurea]
MLQDDNSLLSCNIANLGVEAQREANRLAKEKIDLDRLALAEQEKVTRAQRMYAISAVIAAIAAVIAAIASIANLIFSIFIG